jgi:hypothetical protein
VGDVGVLDKAVIIFLSVIVVAIGIFPSLIVPMVNSGVDRILLILGGR